LSLDSSHFVAGGYFLSHRSRDAGPDWTGTRIRRVSLANDHSPRRFFPDAWTLSWTSVPRDERLANAAAFRIAAHDLDRVLAWGDGAFGAAFGAWSVIYTLDAARDIARTFLATANDLDLWGLGLHRDVLATYCNATAPPPPEPGYAPCGASGVHVAACQRPTPLAPGGEVLGFELLIDDVGCMNSPESLHIDEAAITQQVGVTRNANELIDSFDDALECCRLLDAQHPTAAASGWLPWLLVRYPLLPATDASRRNSP
jgi:hypothetical protein